MTRRVVLLLLVLPTLAAAQLIGGPLQATGVVYSGTGVAPNGAFIKHARVGINSIGAASYGESTLTWTTAFPDANYTVLCQCEGTQTTGVPATTPSDVVFGHTRAKTAANVVVGAYNQDTTTARSCTAHCVAFHD